MNIDKSSIENESQLSCQTAVRRSADLWWKKLNHDLRIQYAKEQSAQRKMILKFNNDGLISGLTLSDVVEIFRHYA